MSETSCCRCSRRIDVVALSFTLSVLASLISSVKAQTSTTTAPSLVTERTYFDEFLAFPPEYVALLGLGVLFVVLFIIVVIIICVTARPKYKY